MKPEAQRIAIARACGLKEIGFIDETLMHAGTGTFLEVPSYLTDLNAMHEAEKVLTGKDRWKFAAILVEMIAGYKPRDSFTRISLDGICKIAHATAAQRAEAFLRTIGKWEESI